MCMASQSQRNHLLTIQTEDRGESRCGVIGGLRFALRTGDHKPTARMCVPETPQIAK